MAQIREIKKRMKAVGNIRRITKTMQMIATSKFARASIRATATKPYTEGVFGLVTELAATAGNIEHPLIDGPGRSEDRELTLILTSDRGLCGAYNSSVLRTMTRHFRGNTAAREGVLELVGKKGVNFLKFNGLTMSRHHTQFGGTPEFDDVARLAQEYIDRFVAGEVSAVRVVYMRYHSAGRQKPEVLQLLPLKPPAAGGEKGERTGPSAQYEFSPKASELLDDLLPETVKATLFQCFNDSIVSEHVSRMIAMKAATDNAGKMKKDLTRTFNRARQAQITTELTEIISGAAALE